MAELGRGCIEYRFDAVCGGCLKRTPLRALEPRNALLEAVANGWGEVPTLGLVCPGCVKKIAAQTATAARTLRENAEAEAAKIVLTDERGNVLE